MGPGGRAELQADGGEGGQVSKALQAFRTLLGPSNMLAYLAMMAPRLVELRRVLKPTGSIYLHCDPTASHYLKMLMDAVFGPENFVNEIMWQADQRPQRRKRHVSAQSRRASLLRKARLHVWNQRTRRTPSVHREVTAVRDPTDGAISCRRCGSLARPNLHAYEWQGLTIRSRMDWATQREHGELDAEGRIYYARYRQALTMKHVPR